MSERIEDTCKCGAKFDSTSRSWANLQYSHQKWLNSHHVCRATLPNAPVTPPPQTEGTDGK